MVSAEFAAALPAVILVLAAAMTALSWAIADVRVQDAARLGARSAARGDSDATVGQLVRKAAPRRASYSVQRSGQTVRVVVTAHLGGPGGWLLSGVTVRGEGVGAVEQDPS